ncbi:Glycosyltransferase family 52 [Cetobacterium ceti]|uniref:Glycosyltransferase family 52 n=2 Tax=Cetobacterium ceti TaxID=180163 RepID=A0A1T4LSH3_9FUSO|nr:Glycosyltransferase family 52 [Cetobacterium ceti]
MGDTKYNLMLYLILFPKEIDNTFYIVGDELEDNLKDFKCLYLKEKKFKIRILNKLYRIFSNYEAKYFFRKNKFETLPIYGLDHWIWNGYEKKYHEIFLIEDGTRNYNLEKEIKRFKNQSLGEKLRWKLYCKKPSFGLSDRVKKIYLTGIGEIPKEIEKKVEIINLYEKWNLLTEEEKNRIRKIFKVTEIDMENIENCDGILITQPLSEDGVLTEKEKIEIYGNILKNYRDKKILIKPHPREKTDYKKYFPHCEIIKGKFPFELILLNGKKLKKLITIFSTGVLIGKENIGIDFYGTEINEKIYKSFGSMEHIYKRNSYINKK